jgi:hypothetical protein
MGNCVSKKDNKGNSEQRRPSAINAPDTLQLERKNSDVQTPARQKGDSSLSRNPKYSSLNSSNHSQEEEAKSPVYKVRKSTFDPLSVKGGD